MTKRPMLGFILLCCSIALAQQPAEWRPNIAEDNKAATWEATKSFIDHTLPLVETDGNTVLLSPRCHLIIRSGEKKKGFIHWKLGMRWIATGIPNEAFEVKHVDDGGFADTIGIKVGMVLKRINGVEWASEAMRNEVIMKLRSGDTVTFVVQIKGQADQNLMGTLRDVDTTGDTEPAYWDLHTQGAGIAEAGIQFIQQDVDFNLVDPLSISLRGTSLIATGSSNVPFVRELRLSGTRVGGLAADEAVDTACVAQQTCMKTDNPNWSINLNDNNELNRRLARAFLHAALLCGGTKAVSPF
jgi:hypothetical protein